MALLKVPDWSWEEVSMIDSHQHITIDPSKLYIVILRLFNRLEKEQSIGLIFFNPKAMKTLVSKDLKVLI